MKRINFLAILWLYTLTLHAQKETDFYKHELKVSVGDTKLPLVKKVNYNFSVAYFIRPVRWLWIGGNFINYLGGKVYYNRREYNTNGDFNEFSKSKLKYCAVIAPEIRFSYINKKSVVLYSAFSTGVGWENGYDSKWEKYPKTISYLHATLFGISCNFGPHNNVFLGSELGIGFKGLINIHGGYRF